MIQSQQRIPEMYASSNINRGRVLGNGDVTKETAKKSRKWLFQES